VWRCSWCGIDNESALCPRCGKKDAIQLDPNHVFRCEKCGVEKHEEDKFGSFRGANEGSEYLCPDCHDLHCQVEEARFSVGYFVVAVIVSVFGLVWKRHLLNEMPVFIAAVFVLQVLLILPHELGHALIGRAFRYPDIRIFIGFGKPLAIFRFFGFQWAVNSIPTGGLTYVASPDAATSWRYMCFAAGGLMVNLLIALLCLPLLPEKFYADGQWTWLEALFYTNLVVIFENLIPYSVRTPAGIVQLCGVLFISEILLTGWITIRWKAVEQVSC
jgi:hypothetical protein